MYLTKIKNQFSIRRLGALVVLGILISIKLTGVLSAQTVTKGYGSDQVMQRGMVVGVQKNNAAKVEPINISRINNILGVVVNPNDSPITISSDNQHIFVASTGRYDVLVSDQEGPINSSDYVTLSALSGIAMKATDAQLNVLGRAASSFDGKTNILSTTELQDNKGAKKTVHISRIKVDIAIARNPLSRNADNTPAILSQAGRAIAGKSVSALRLYLSAIIFIAGTIVAGSIMYAGVRSSITAIGRNPLSRRSIFKSLAGVALTSLVVFAISALGVYLLLRL